MALNIIKLSHQIEEIVQQGIQENVFPGASVWIGQHDGTIHCAAYGHTANTSYGGYHPTAVTLDTLYDLASLTKVIATTCAIMHLVEQRALMLSDPIAKYLPEFGDDQQKASVTIWHLLTHTSGLLGPLPLYKEYQNKKDIIKAIYRQRLLFPPGTQHLYCDIGFILLGEVIPIISSFDLKEYSHQHLFEPLDMKDTMFTPPKELWHRVAPTEYASWRGGLVHGQVHDENAWFMGGIAGHAGLFSTIKDVAKFCTMFLNLGKHLDKKVLGTSSISNMILPQSSTTDEVFGLGWTINSSWFMGSLAGQETFGHTGFTGTSIVMNLRRDVALVFLANSICPTRNGPNINPYRRKIANSLFNLISEVQ